MLVPNLLGDLPSLLSLFDPGWWDRMLDATNTGHASPEALILTTALFSLVGLALAAGLLIKRVRRDTPPPVTWIVKPAEIRALFETALAQRSKMRVSFVRDDPGARSTDATVLSVAPGNGIELEMTSLVKANASWVGKLVACDFRLRLDPRKEYHNFYNFVVPILAIRKASDDFVHMTVDWPTRLELEQKRAFLRVEPQRSFILELELWHEVTIQQARGSFAVPTSWGAPLLRLDPNQTPPDLEMRNISGGGMRLEIQPDAIKRHLTLFDPGGRFIMRLVLAEPEAEQPVEFYLALRLQNIYGAPDSLGLRAFGFRFLSYGVFDPNAPATLSWKTAASGIPPLDDWAFRRHLSSYRQRGE